ncbi:MAG: glycoside hydrolase family 31 protein [Chitinispirillaceae bacterium]|nr:glycoside hydrolase family 31 protein [Chitinispirillaceae bacterium]
MLKKMAGIISGILFLVVAASGWTFGELTVDVTNSPMDIKVSAGGKTLADITAFTFGSVRYTTISSVTSNTTTMTITLASNYTVTITGIEGGLYFKSTNPSVSSVMLTLKDQGEHFYGITEHNIETNPDLRGKSNIKDQVTAYQRSDEDAEVYSGFYYTTLGYAGFFDSFAYGTYSFAVSSQTTITYNTSTINWYLFYGPSLSKVHKHFFKVIGAPRLVPMWACGPLVWHDNYTGSAMILDHAVQFAAVKIPYSTIWLDRPYNNGSQGWSNMNFEGDFGNPGTWIKTLSDQYYVNLVTWIMPGVFDGTPPAGAFTSSDNQYLDLTDQTQVNWYRNKLKTGQYPYGIMGHKLDRIDNGWGSDDLPPFKDGTPAAERHKKYAYLNCKISEEFLRVDAGLGLNCFIFPRCAVARCQQYISAIWNGDTYADWGGLVTSVGNSFRAGILGFPMWGSDICGYKQKSMPSIQNYCRWLSYGVYSGFMELMLDGKEPWKLSEANQEYVREIFNQRFDLLPYIYSIINTSAENGVTMKPLVGEYPDDSKTYSLVDEYLFGPAMLVAPITSNSNSRSVYLPAGKWINMHNWADEQTGGGSNITSPTMSLTQIPVYIKANSIYPTGQVFAGLAKKWDPAFDSKRTIAINAFPGAAGQSVSFTYVDYVDGDKKKVMTCAVAANNAITISAPAMTVPGTVVVRLPSAPTSVYLGTTQITAPAYDATAKKLTVPFVANQPITVTVNGTPTGIAEPYEPVQAKGRMTAMGSGKGVALTIPRMTGLSGNSVATVRIFSMAGREIIKKNVPLNRYSSTPVSIVTGKGVFLVTTSVTGISAGTAKIIVP